MKPAVPALLLAFALSGSASAEPAASAACPTGAYAPGEGLVKLSPDSPVCARWPLLVRDFQRLRNAAAAWAEKAGRELGVRPRFDVRGVDFGEPQFELISNGHYFEWPAPAGSVRLSTDFIEREDDETAVFLLSHELAHAVQAALDLGEGCRSASEAQADLWGLEIAKAAGFNLRRGHEPIVRWFGEVHLRDDARNAPGPDCAKHPTGRQRVVNALLSDKVTAMTSGVRAAWRGPEATASEAPGSAPAAQPALSAAASRPKRQADFTATGALLVASPIRPPAAPGPLRAGSVPEAYRSALYELGNRSAWTDPMLVEVIAAGGMEGADLDEALARGWLRLFPGQAAAREAVETLMSLTSGERRD